ncbi:MAG: DUF4347 domain-containing protein, partial [Cyanobacteria bacterium P01_F01_bin.3]
MTSMLLSQSTRASVKSTIQNSLIIIDSGVTDVSALVADVIASQGQTDVLLLSADRDGIEQITEALSSYTRLSSLHIVSHATPGCLHLGSTQLSFETLDQHADSLEKWATLLSGKDVLLYGCQVAKGAMGYLFVQQLQQLTGANIAASTDRIGRVGDRTNWVLDTQIGKVQTPVVFSEQLQASYASHFETVNFSVSTNTLVESEGTPFSFNFTVDGDIPAGGSVVRLSADRPQAINQWNLFALSFEGVAGQPVDVSPNMDFSAFEVTITSPTASISLPVFNDFVDDSPDAYTWTAEAVSPGTTVNIVGDTTTTIFDDAGEVPSDPPPAPVIPEISLTSDITTLVEDEGTEVTLTLELSEAPASPVIVTIDTGKPFALGDFDVFPPPPQASATGGQLVSGNQDNSGFNFAITEQTATISLPIFDDPDRVPDGATTNPNDELRNDDQGEEQTTFTLQPGDGYTVGSANSVTLTLVDTLAPPNTDPDAEDDSYTTAFESPLTVNAANGVLGNDSDADGDDLTVSVD